MYDKIAIQIKPVDIIHYLICVPLPFCYDRNTYDVVSMQCASIDYIQKLYISSLPHSHLVTKSLHPLANISPFTPIASKCW